MTERTWWNRENRPFDRTEIVADAVVHLLGIAIALSFGSVLLVVAIGQTATVSVIAVVVYLISLIAVLAISLAFNTWPVTPFKRHLARLDQAAIFLLISGTYTPILATLGPTPVAVGLLTAIWAASIVGIALKIFVPERFGRVAIVLYLAIGWSGLLVFQNLASILPPTSLWLILAGGIVYSLGIIFHLWEKLRFQNAVWHSFVVLGASLHLWATFESMAVFID